MGRHAVELIGILGIIAGVILLVRYVFDESEWMLSVGLLCVIVGVSLYVVAILWRWQREEKEED
jgi:uncharacterized membrane protein HdeD (DUF308 family)